MLRFKHTQGMCFKLSKLFLKVTRGMPNTNHLQDVILQMLNFLDSLALFLMQFERYEKYS